MLIDMYVVSLIRSVILFQCVESTSIPDPLRASALVTSAMLVCLTTDGVSYTAMIISESTSTK
jgi:hypothetical protein